VIWVLVGAAIIVALVYVCIKKSSKRQEYKAQRVASVSNIYEDGVRLSSVATV
jgi:hypothetical protein